MNVIYFTLSFLFVFVLSTTKGRVLSKEKNSSRVISMPLVDNLKATLKADVDTSELNKYVQAYIDQEVENRFQHVQDMIEVDIKRVVEEAVAKMNESIMSTPNFSTCQCSSTIPNKTVKYKDCSELKNEEKGPQATGIYTIYPDPNGEGVQAYCDMTTDGGGWTVIQKRFDGSVDFQRTWEECKNGFGTVSGEFWFGNKYTSLLTSSGKYELRVDLEKTRHKKRYAVYKTFKVGDEGSKYRLTVGNYSGNAGDELSYSNGQGFTTIDQDNDNYGSNCATLWGQGPWWHKGCYSAHLNTKYEKKMQWSSDNIIKSIMMVRKQ